MQVRLMEPQTATQSSDQKFQENPDQPTLPNSKFQALPMKLEEGKTRGEFKAGAAARTALWEGGISLARRVLPWVTPGCGTGMMPRCHWIPGCQTGRVWVALDTGSSVPKTQKGHGQGGQWLQPQEGPAQPWSLQCPFQNPCEPNRDNPLTGLSWDPPPSIPGTPRTPSPATSPSISPWSQRLAPSLNPHPLGAPQVVVTKLSGLRLEPHTFLLFPHGKQGGFWGRCGAPAPKNPYGHTLGSAGVGKKCSRLGSFPSTAKSLWPQPKSHRLQARWIPQLAGHGAHGGSGGPVEMGGRLCPPQLHPGAVAKLAQPGPKALAVPSGLWDTMSPRRPHRDTATGTETPGKGLARGRGGQLQYGKTWKRLPGPRKGSSEKRPAGREGSPRQAAKHAGIFVLGSLTARLSRSPGAEV